MSRCVICDSTDADNEFRFAAVDVKTSSETQYYVVAKKTTTTVRERFAGVCRESFCTKCLKKQRTKYILTATVATFFLTILCMLVIGLNAGVLSAGFFIATIIIAVIAAIIAIACTVGKKEAFHAGALLFEKRNRQLRYVPVDPSLYAVKGKTTIEKFKERSNLRTEVANKIYEKFIESGRGNELVDEIISNSASQS